MWWSGFEAVAFHNHSTSTSRDWTGVGWWPPVCLHSALHQSEVGHHMWIPLTAIEKIRNEIENELNWMLKSVHVFTREENVKDGFMNCGDCRNSMLNFVFTIKTLALLLYVNPSRKERANTLKPATIQAERTSAFAYTPVARSVTFTLMSMYSLVKYLS